MFPKKQTHIICPFCCHRIHPNEAEFRLATGDKTMDEKLLYYNKNILDLDTKDAELHATKLPTVSLSHPSVSYDEIEYEKNGFVQQITFTLPQGVKEISDQRVCPNCHNNLPIGYGMRDTVLISVLGDARSGKSVFLTMLINELENNMDFASKLTFIGDKQVRTNFFETYQKPLLKEHKLINSTKRKKIPPYAFNYWYQYKDEDGNFQENAVDIIFYDIAGEDLRDTDGIRKNGFNIKDSSGLIFLIDPTNFRRLADLFMFSDAALIDAIPDENSNQAIFDTLYNYFLGNRLEKSQIPLALAISKADLFKHVNLDFFKNRPENRVQFMLDDEIHRGALNMPSIKGMNEEVRELLSYLNEDGILGNAMGCFKNINCFAISSLGKKPKVEQISNPSTNETVEQGIVEPPLKPFRVKDPFYWILMRNGLMLKHEGGLYGAYGSADSKATKHDLVPSTGIAGFITRIGDALAHIFKGKR